MTHPVCPAPRKDTILLSHSQHLPSHLQPALVVCSIALPSSAICNLWFPPTLVVQPVPLCSRPSTELVTTQCHSCLIHLPEGMNFCPCGACLRPDENTINIIQMIFKAFTVPHYLARINRSRRKKCGEQQWQTDHWKAQDAMREQ